MAGNGSAAYEYVSRIVKPQPIDRLQAGVIEFLEFVKARHEDKEALCGQLLQAIIDFGKPYLQPLPSQGKNVVFIPPKDAPVMMITTCVPATENAELIIKGLNKFVERCGEFSGPQADSISETEMDLVLDAAQKKFGILDIIATFRPLKILSLDNSHHTFNCECGISDNHSREAVIFVYHPRDVSVYDRIFIFAHEIGHALHLALTSDISQTPKRFDEFNESLGIKGLSVHEKQENFADAVAIAILNSDGLREHLPDQLLKQLPPYFERYVRFLADDFFKTLHWPR